MIEFKIKLWALVSISSLLLMGCVGTEYRGVPQLKWQKLTTEQKQMVVDEGYTKEYGPTEGMNAR